MATILCDKEIRRLIENNIIVDGDPECISPNSYILRLGDDGEILNSGTRFKPGEFKALQVLPGHSVGITAQEKLNFNREIVHKLYPNSDLHGIISPTTDLSREGVIAPTTQVDAGFSGSLNWTLNNTSGSLKKEVNKINLIKKGV